MRTLSVRLDGDSIQVGEHIHLSFLRTLRLPDDGKVYPLPPGFSRFPLVRVEDYADRVPTDWRAKGGFIMPMYQREALWLSFSAPHWRPNVLKVAAGGINAATGGPLTDTLLGDTDARNRESSTPVQDYLVVPEQPWLDGFKTAPNQVRQFVAMPLGMGYTVEGQLTGKETEGGIQILVYEPRPGRFPDKAPRPRRGRFDGFVVGCSSGRPYEASMGLGAGGRMRQSIYPDTYGIETWQPTPAARITIHIANSMQWREITGQNPPATPITAQEYARHCLPWFDLYDDGLGDLMPQPALMGIESVSEIDAEHGFASLQDDTTVPIPANLVTTLSAPVSNPEWPKPVA